MKKAVAQCVTPEGGIICAGRSGRIMWRREGEGDVVPLTRFVGGSGQAHLLVYACAHPSESAPTPCATTEEVIDAGDQIRFGAGNVRLKDAPTQGEPLFPLGFAHSSITQYSVHTCGISSVPALERHSLTYSASHSGPVMLQAQMMGAIFLCAWKRRRCTDCTHVRRCRCTHISCPVGTRLALHCTRTRGYGVLLCSDDLGKPQRHGFVNSPTA